MISCWMVGTTGKFMSATHMGMASKPSLGGRGGKAGAQAVHGDGIFAVAFENGRKIVFHDNSLNKNPHSRKSPVCGKNTGLALDELHGLHLDRGGGLIVPVGADSGDLIHHIHAGHHLAKGGILAVQVGVRPGA